MSLRSVLRCARAIVHLSSPSLKNLLETCLEIWCLLEYLPWTTTSPFACSFLQTIFEVRVALNVSSSKICCLLQYVMVYQGNFMESGNITFSLINMIADNSTTQTDDASAERGISSSFGNCFNIADFPEGGRSLSYNLYTTKEFILEYLFVLLVSMF